MGSPGVLLVVDGLVLFKALRLGVVVEWRFGLQSIQHQLDTTY